jgi:NADP-dependent 3-hydroxy acid dehydrogenase YdfG
LTTAATSGVGSATASVLAVQTAAAIAVANEMRIVNVLCPKELSPLDVARWKRGTLQRALADENNLLLVKSRIFS